MTHYVLIKLKPGVDLDAAEKKIAHTYRTLEEMLPYVSNLSVRRNCVARNTNADFMISIDLDDEKNLQPYLTHPLHRQLAEEMEDQVAQRTSFDHL